MAIELNPLLWPDDPPPLAPPPPPTLPELYAKLEDMRAGAPWGRYEWGDPIERLGDGSPPSPLAFDRCRTLLGILGDLQRVPRDVLPYADEPGGVGPVFSSCAWIICANDGKVFAEELYPTHRKWEIGLTVEGVREALAGLAEGLEQLKREVEAMRR
jgi:hypothetical protein